MSAHAAAAGSTDHVRAKVFDIRLVEADFDAILHDLLASRLSDLEIAAFATACAGDRLDLDETVALTRAMIAVGERLDWGDGFVLDKHCVGGLPGNRTSPIVVPIVAALGYRVPKTSSPAITSPAGTADVMATMTRVDLGLDLMRRVVEAHGGCLASGGRMHLSLADDLLIQVERPLDFDSDGQMVASILSKKAAAGSTHVLIDIPVGPTAKVRTHAAADAIARRLAFVGEGVGLRVGIHLSDDRQPVGWGIGPTLEARDVLAVLRNEADAPADLRERSLDVAGAVLDLLPGSQPGAGRARALDVLQSGQALQKFLAICEAQGGFSEPPAVRYVGSFRAQGDGAILSIHNRHLARVAKLAGAPRDPTAGVRCVWRVGDRVKRGDELLVVQAGTRGGLDFGLAYASAHPEIFAMGSH